MQVILDESGDLGWSFIAPFRQGGSSRYLTLAFLIVPKTHLRRPASIIGSMYKQYGWKKEKKASTATVNQKRQFCNSAFALFQKYRDIKLDVITVKKENVQEHIRADANKLYNFMVNLVVPLHVKGEQCFDFIVDERSVKVKSQNSLHDYLQTKLWCELNVPTVVNYYPTESDQDYNVQFVDWIANCIWSSYEDGASEWSDILRPVSRFRELYF